MVKYFININNETDKNEYTDIWDAIYDALDYLGFTVEERSPEYGTIQSKLHHELEMQLMDYMLREGYIIEYEDEQEEDACYSYWDAMYEQKNNY